MQLITAAFAAFLLAGEVSQADGTTIPDCLVSTIRDINVPAKEAGVLTELRLSEGTSVKQGETIARIDDAHARSEQTLAEINHDRAKVEAANDVNVRYAHAAADVAEAEYQAAVEANERVGGAVAPAELRRLKLEHRRSLLQIEQAALEQKLLQYAVQSATAARQAAEENIRRHRIVSPIDGEIVKVHRHAGEWVNPGDSVVQIIQLNRLRIEGFLSDAKYVPGDVMGRPVTAVVRLPRNRMEKFSGKIVFVNPTVKATGEFLIRAEVDNRQENGQWLLQPGKSATLHIHQ